MRDIKRERFVSAIAKAAANFIARESNRTSLITVIGVSLSEHGRECVVCVTVLPPEKESTALEFLKRKRSLFRKFLAEEVRGWTLPRVDFAVDLGEKNRQRIETLSGK